MNDLALDAPAPLARADHHPVAVYLARLSPGGRRSMRSALRTILRTIGSDATLETFPWHQVEYQHAAAIRSELASRYAPATANQALSALRGVLREARRLGLVSSEAYTLATDFERVPGVRVPRGRALAAGEIRALFGACGDGARGVRDRALLAILYGGGLRRAEVCSLSVQDWDGAALRVLGKGGKERLVPLPGGAARALEAWLALCPRAATDPLLLPVGQSGNLRPGRLTGEGVLMVLRALAQRAGVKEFSPHDCRRTFVSDLLDAGADIATVQRLAGHADPATTARYDRRGEAAKQRAVDLLHIPAPEDP